MRTALAVAFALSLWLPPAGAQAQETRTDVPQAFWFEIGGFRVSSNTDLILSGTTPGDKHTVVMEWTDDSLESPYRRDRVSVGGLGDLAAQLREISLESNIEFWELMTDDKHLD